MARAACRHFGLSFDKIVPATHHRYTNKASCEVCERCDPKVDDGTVTPENCTKKVITIRVHQRHHPTQPLRPKTIVGSLAHELAHLRPDAWKHGPVHTQFTKEILTFFRDKRYLANP
jgi:hypothetical protein